MFELISKLAEILSSHWGGFVDGKRAGKDADVAAHLVRLLTGLQDLCVRGQQLLEMAERLVDGDDSPELSAEFVRLLDEQAQAVDGIRSQLDGSQTVLATIDADFYLDLAPLVDKKSGLLTRWCQQVARSHFSTTTLFFLPANDVTRIVDAGRSDTNGLGIHRPEYTVALAESIRSIGARAVRDIRQAPVSTREQVNTEIATARADLAGVRDYCSTLLSAIQETVGTEAMAMLRRKALR
ncbi:hypothetical protein [Nocardia cyriacigeorgica]|uniref:hypothetical protein n=1 Tax=Nocardia cyriacigeorgica TaxID=135487 RepID=UPI002457C566|nr:hypothetical protein [Nocardia cyriacigeorgica]